MSKKLENRVAVITGATSGMALATAKLFVEEGIRLCHWPQPRKARQSSQRYRQECHWRSGQCRQSLRPRSAVRDSQKREGPYRHHLC